jgi:hypothetical protein
MNRERDMYVIRRQEKKGKSPSEHGRKEGKDKTISHT